MTRIASAFSKTASSLNDPGSTSSVVVIAPGHYVVDASVSSSDVGALKKGMQAQVTPTDASGSDQPIFGTVTSVGMVAQSSGSDGSGSSGAASFPVEVTVANDAEGAPHLTAPGDLDLRVSIAHTAGLGVAIVGEGVDVGIDIEHVEGRPDSFELAALSKKERARFEALPDIDRESVRERELTRWWAAKEAAAKAAGTGMQGRPKDWKVEEVDGDRVRIGERWIATTTIDGGHIVAWTETR